MPAIELKASELCPMHAFERRQAIKRNSDGEDILAYVQVPLKDDQGNVVFEEYPTPTGNQKRPVLTDDIEQPIELHIIKIRPHNSKDEHEMDAKSFIAQCERQSRMVEPLYKKEWADQYRLSYNNWLAGIEQRMLGTDIMTWAGVSQAQRKHLQNLGFVTIEQIATANEQGLMQIGTGGRAMKYAATEWLAKQDTLDAKQLKTTVETLQASNAELREMVEKLLAAQSGGAVAEPAKSSTLHVKTK